MAVQMASKRAALLKTTKQLLWEVGYEAMSPKKVLEKSGAGQGSLYHHFSSKEMLATTALGEVATEMRAEFDKIVQSEASPIEKLRKFLATHRVGTKGCRLGRLANEQSFQTSGISGPVREYFSYVEAELSAILTDAREKRQIRENVAPKRSAGFIIASLQGAFVMSKLHNDNHYMSDVAKCLLDYINDLQR